MTVGPPLSFPAPIATPQGFTSLYPDADVSADDDEAAEEDDGGEEEDDDGEGEENDDGEGQGQEDITSTITRTVLPVQETIPTVYSTRTTLVPSTAAVMPSRPPLVAPPGAGIGSEGEWECIPNTIQCVTPGAYALCIRTSRIHSTFVFVGGVPRGTVCLGGQILGVAASGRNSEYPGFPGGYGDGDGGCTPPGSVVCGERGSMFRLCAPVGWVEVKRLPGGVVCLENELWGRGRFEPVVG